MANTLTNLEPDLYRAMQVVSREMVGLIPAVNMDFNAEEAAKDQVIRSFQAPEASAANTTPGQLPPDTGDQTFTNRTLTIDKDRHVAIRWTAEEQKSMNTGPGYNAMRVNQFAQAMRTLTNEVEADLAALYTEASRAAQPAGTNLFDSTGKLKDAAEVRQILIDNGAPRGDMHLVLDSTAHVDYLGLTQLTNVNEAGNDNLLRQGVLGDIFGMAVRHSAEIDTHTAGTADANTTTDSSGYSIGDTEITLASAGTGTILAGDVIKFAGDDNAYVVTSGDADVSNGGTITIQEPGLRQAIPASTTDITVQSDTSRNMAFSRDAIALATRVPALPIEGDSATDRMIIQDPVSGLAFQVLEYREYKRVHYEIGLAWGAAVMNPRHLALLVD